jgi:hypothetical protein
VQRGTLAAAPHRARLGGGSARLTARCDRDRIRQMNSRVKLDQVNSGTPSQLLPMGTELALEALVGVGFSEPVKDAPLFF